jgi:glyoxylase-like metal-dependent hydrolase (beta-lactamase superfamily II)
VTAGRQQEAQGVAIELRYPLPQEPDTGDGSAVQVAPGLLWLRMPLPGSLRWINVWAMDDGHGWTIVDTGFHTPQSIEAWQAAFGGALHGKAVTRVIVTHMHPDHCGMAGWIVDRFAATLWMTRLEYLTCRLMAADTGKPAPGDGIRFYRSAGWDEESLQQYRERFGQFGRMIFPMPASYRRISDGDVLAIGDREWTVVVGHGHSPEHACLYSPELKVLISGDQVLPRISSNVSVHPTEPEANPLHDWLTSLARVKSRVPDDVLVLPAHNSPFTGLHARIDQLTDGHLTQLAGLEQFLAQPRRVIDTFGILFSRPIAASQLGMATGEALAHLNYLHRAGRVIRERDDKDVWWWRRVNE